jgi:Holliday junction DNA helicase RuvB
MSNLRPTKLTDIIGQKNIVERLKISIDAAKKDGRPLPHILASGPPGLGKTTLCTVIANEMDSEIYIANGGGVRTIKLLLPYLAKLNYGDILFIDEIHRLSASTSEFLYPVLEDFRADIGTEQEAVTLELQPFTLIGATTESGRIAAPLLDRFVYKYQLTTYDEDDLAEIIEINARKLDVNIEDEACGLIAKRSRGTPRIANSYLRWIKDYTTSQSKNVVNGEVVHEAMTMANIDERGLTNNDRRYLKVLEKARGPLGIRTLASSTNVALETIEQTIEPFLLRLGLIMKTPKGRMLCV